MTKIYGLFLLMTLGLSLSAFADESSTVGNIEAQSQVTCAAQTTCYPPMRRPYTIQCQVAGDGCTWWSTPNSSVHCAGYNQYGQWVNLLYVCR